jgi:hypothetical protein
MNIVDSEWMGMWNLKAEQLYKTATTTESVTNFYFGCLRIIENARIIRRIYYGYDCTTTVVGATNQGHG